MATRTLEFDEVVSDLVASDATKKNQKKICHTWDGWVSKGVLHVTSRSGARRREIWHFDVEKNAGRLLFFKNTTGTADCWTKGCGDNALEKFILDISPHVKIQRVSNIDHVVHSRGSCCNHSLNRFGVWCYYLTDGSEALIHKANTVKSHFNQYHIGCPTEPDQIRVTGGTYAVQWTNKNTLTSIVYTPDADMASVIEAIRSKLRSWGYYS
ncbi:MAG: hypothetical protein R3B60_01670 [Candidatus Paceibacterota bacterium]